MRAKRARRQQYEKSDTHRRALWIAAGLCVWTLGIIGRLAWLQIADHDHYVARAALNQRREIETVPTRGLIVDRNNHELAISVVSDSLFVDLKQLKEEEDRKKAAQSLSPLLGIGESDLLKKLEGSSSFVWLKRKLDPDASQAIKQTVGANKLHGIAVQKETQRFYPNDSLAAHLVGYVDAYDKGIAGIEHRFDGLLNGKSGEIAFDKDAQGRAYKRTEIPAVNGAQVVLTIDSALQHKVETLLDEAVRMTRAKGGSAIVLEPKTGEILALANVPTFNPNERPKTADDRERHNRAISWPYEPGSVFKLVTYAAAFEEGLIKPDDKINCGGGEITIGKRVIHDTHAYGLLTVEEAFAKSSNIGAIRVAMKMGREKFFDYISRFGFGRKAGIELPGESRGIVNPLADWRIDSIGSVAIGQEISITLLQGAAAIGAIANGGVWVKPHIVKQVVAHDGRVLYEPKIETREVVSPETAQLMTRILERVVTHGTARHAIKLNGYTVAGKTGTPQKVDERTRAYSQTKYMPSFAGFVPGNDPRFAIIVMIDEPQGAHQGGSVAAPVFNLIAEAALGDYAVPPDDKQFRQALVALSEKYESKSKQESEEDSQTGPAREIKPDDISANISSLPRNPNQAKPAPSPPPSKTTPQVSPSPRSAPADVVATYVMPDFSGRGVRAVTQACTQMNLVIRLHGSGLAVRQSPAPGAKVRVGDVCRVEFQ
jgi:cell division protein FtsI (penicillin-binding protein 3)